MFDENGYTIDTTSGSDPYYTLGGVNIDNPTLGDLATMLESTL
jgi:hypothetical protein